MRHGSFRSVAAVVFASLLPLGLCARGQDAKPRETVSVLAAGEDILDGFLIKERHEALFRRVRYVKGDEPKGALTDFKQLNGRRTARALAKGQHVREGDLIVNEHGELPVIRKGLQPAAIPASGDHSLLGFVMPGNIVDVIAITESERGKLVANTLVRRVRVLAVYMLTDPNNKTNELTNLTVEVTPEQAATLAQPRPKSRLRFALCAVDDKAPGGQGAVAEDLTRLLPEKTDKPR